MAFAETANKTRAADRSPITIEAEEFLEWDQNEGTYTAKVQGFVQQSDTSIRAAHIIARYNASSETRSINHFIATGNVAHVEGKTPPKDKLDYDLTANFYFLAGENTGIEVSWRRQQQNP